MKDFAYSDSIDIAAAPETLYEMVSDITRMGEWSPVNTGGRWKNEERGVGAWFVGHNETAERTWETECRVVTDEPGRAFAFLVGGNRTYWGYTFEPIPGGEGGTRVTESWRIPPEAEAAWTERLGDDRDAQLEKRADAARAGIGETLAALKRAAEGPAE